MIELYSQTSTGGQAQTYETNRDPDIQRAADGVPPDILARRPRIDLSRESGSPTPFHLLPLHLAAEEVEVLLCFALSSPLDYGQIEERICAKLRDHLRLLYRRRPLLWRFRKAPALCADDLTEH